MRKLIFSMTALVFALNVCGIPHAFADEAALQNQVTSLTDKVSSLERSLRAMEGKLGKTSTEYVAVDGNEKKGLVKAAQDINLGGYVAAGWNNNFRQPKTLSGARTATGAQTNTLRVFDKYDGSFTVDAAKVFLEKKAEKPGEAGFRTDILMGEDAAIVNADATNDTFQLEQAYAEYIAPLSFWDGNSVLPDQIHVKAGRFTTLAGLEVIEAPDNWNISRSLMFGYAVPFTHTGVRTHFGLFNKKLDVYMGLNNGWDLPIDNNSFKTQEYGVGYKLFDKVNVMHAIYYGGENNEANGGRRFLSSNTFTYDVTSKLSLAGDVQIGRQNRAIADGASQDNANWYGFAAYAKYKVTDKLGLALRGEVFRDPMNFRTGLSSTTFEQTITADYHLTDNLIARGEFRFDKSNNDKVFPGAHTSGTGIGAQMIYVI